MSENKINYQAIYENEVSHNLLESLEKSTRFYDLSNQERLLIEELVDAGYRRAVEEALDTEVLTETAELAGDMGSQLYNFANMIQSYLKHINSDESSI